MSKVKFINFILKLIEESDNSTNLTTHLNEHQLNMNPNLYTWDPIPWWWKLEEPVAWAKVFSHAFPHDAKEGIGSFIPLELFIDQEK